jgi:hypothetical protein
MKVSLFAPAFLFMAIAGTIPGAVIAAVPGIVSQLPRNIAVPGPAHNPSTPGDNTAPTAPGNNTATPQPQPSAGPVAQTSPSPAFTPFYTPFPQVTMHPPIPSPDAATASPEAEPSPTTSPTLQVVPNGD